MSRTVLLYILAIAVTLYCTPRVVAFGAGNIPSYSYLEDKAFRHGDIEDIIATLFKTAGGGFLSRGTKFSPLDVKRCYFGNWLRDYSQAVDVGALKKINVQTILNVVMVLGFLAHGFVTNEFEVTKERLGCYLPTEHIDNPKGYAEGEDARQYDPRLRGPVDPMELEIDPRTGMKNYIRNENGTWDTSSALIRRTLQECVHMGRLFRQSNNKADAYQAFQLLGSALHTLEDFTAHSNWCELTLISFGYQNVFPHVGQNVKMRAPNGRDVFPIVTGTFGGADFIYSLMGEATDHLSQASVSDLSRTMENARSAQAGQSSSAGALRQMLFDIPGDGGGDLMRDMDGIQNMRAGQPGGVDPNMMSPQELHGTLWQILSFRDSVMKRIENTIDRIPGLAGLVEKISNSITVFIITTLEPFVKPLIGTATGALGASSQAVIDSQDQYEVWNNCNASDPTHSYLSKDHFALILNQPAGEIAQCIVEFTVKLVVEAWDHPGMPIEQLTEPVLECLFHPDFHDGQSRIQRLMLDKMRAWIDSRGYDKQEVMSRLSSNSVKIGNNKRIRDQSPTTEHLHNSMLSDVGLQQLLAQHDFHIPGAQVLNSGQDLLSGKMPWQQGFGAGGQHAWRDINDEHPSDVPPSLAPYEQNAASFNVSACPGLESGFRPAVQCHPALMQQGYPAQPPPAFGPYPPPNDGFANQHFHRQQSPYPPPLGGYEGGYGGPQPIYGQQLYGEGPRYVGQSPFAGQPQFQGGRPDGHPSPPSWGQPQGQFGDPPLPPGYGPPPGTW